MEQSYKKNKFAPNRTETFPLVGQEFNVSGLGNLKPSGEKSWFHYAEGAKARTEPKATSEPSYSFI